MQSRDRPAKVESYFDARFHFSRFIPAEVQMLAKLSGLVVVSLAISWMVPILAAEGDAGAKTPSKSAPTQATQAAATDAVPAGHSLPGEACN